MLKKSLMHGLAYVNKMFQPSQPITTNLPLLSYQHFFRRIYKSYKADETIKIYQDYREMSAKSIKYLTLTLRMLTRILKKQQLPESHLINQFIEKNFTTIKSIESTNVPIDDFKNVMLFALSHVNSNKNIVSPHFLIFTRNILSKYLQQFQQLNHSDQLINFQNIISAIKPIAANFNELSDSYSSVLIKFFTQHKEDLVVENLTFKTALEALEYSFTATNTAIFPFLQLIAGHVLDKKLIPTLEHTTLVYLINVCYKCSSQAQMRGINLQPQVEEVIGAIDQYLIDTLSKLSGHSIEILLPILLKNNPKGKFVTHYYSIIALSVNQKGSTCLHPLLIIQSFSFLTPSQINLLTDVNSNWEANFLKFLQLYFHSKNKFERNISELLYEISSKRMLQPQNQLAFKKFCDQYRPYAKGDRTIQYQQHRQIKQQETPKDKTSVKVEKYPSGFVIKKK